MMKKFKKQKLTKKQLEIMKILWNSPTPMIASDIEYHTGLSAGTDESRIYQSRRYCI